MLFHPLKSARCIGWGIKVRLNKGRIRDIRPARFRTEIRNQNLDFNMPLSLVRLTGSRRCISHPTRETRFCYISFVWDIGHHKVMEDVTQGDGPIQRFSYKIWFTKLAKSVHSLNYGARMEHGKYSVPLSQNYDATAYLVIFECFTAFPC